MKCLLTLLVVPLAVALAFVPTPFVVPIAAAQPAKKGTNYAFMVAGARYTHLQAIEGEETINDILEFKKVLTETGFDEANIVLMHDKQAEKGAAGARFLPEHDKILKELDLFLDGMKPEDTVLLVLSGHGVLFDGEKTGYFCPVDAKLTPKAKLIPMDGPGSIYDHLEKCKAGRKLLISNTCRNAPTVARRDDLAGDKVKLIDDYPESVPKGIAAFYSCDKGQKSYFDAKRGRSLFFIHLTDAWRGKYKAGDGPLTLEAVFDKTREKTKADANATKGEKQFPVVRRGYEGEWLVSGTSSEVRMGETAVQMPEELIGGVKKRPPVPTKVIPANGQVPYVWCASDGLPCRYRIEDTSPINATLKFMQRCVIAASDDNTNRVLLVEKNDTTLDIIEVYGWVNRDLVLDRREAKVSEATKLHKKAACVVSVNTLRAGGVPNKEPEETILTWKPEANAERKVTAKLYIPFFVYASYGDEKTGFVLLGTAPFLNPDRRDDAKEVILGWIPASRITIWDTREGIEFDYPSTQPGQPRNFKDTKTLPARVYRNHQHAYDALKGTPTDGFFDEVYDPKTGVASRMTASQMRYLVLPWVRAQDGPRDTDPEKFPEETNLNGETYRLLRVGVYGGKAPQASAKPGPELEKYFKELGLTAAYEEFLKNPGAQIFQVGYIWDKNPSGVRQIRSNLLVNNGELEIVRDCLKRLDPKRDKVVGGKTPSLDEIIEQVVKAQSGELEPEDRKKIDPRTSSIEDVFRSQIKGLKFQSEFLKKSAAQTKAAKLTEQQRHDLWHKAQLLNDVLENKTYEYKKYKTTFNNVEVVGFERLSDTGKSNPEDNFFYIERRTKWYWIDMEAVWP